MEQNEKKTMSGKDWIKFLESNGIREKRQEEVYVETYNYTEIYRVNGYYFTFKKRKGYRNLTQLKREL